MRILIIGAGGQIARFAIQELLSRTDAHLTLFLRNPASLPSLPDDRVTVVRGDALSEADIASVLPGHDLVFANLSGSLDQAAQVIVDAMEASDVSRLIFVSSMGIYDEVPGERHGAVLNPYRRAAAIVEASNLDYTVIRPAWLNNSDEIAYGLTRRDEPFQNAGATVSRRSVADVIVRITEDPTFASHDSLGIHHS